MCVTVDYEQLPADSLGLRTVGHVLSHLQRGNRLVVNLLIDGQSPDLDRMGSVRQSPLDGHTLFIETAEPREMALDVLAEVEAQLAEADRLKSEAVALLQRNGSAAGAGAGASKAMEKLSGCFSTWHHAQESVLKTAQLLRIDLQRVEVSGRTLTDVADEFSSQLREIKAALEARDFVALADILTYEMTETTAHWRAALGAMREVIG